MHLFGARIEIEFANFGFLLQRSLLLIIQILRVVAEIDLGLSLKRGCGGSLNSRDLGLECPCVVLEFDMNPDSGSTRCVKYRRDYWELLQTLCPSDKVWTTNDNKDIFSGIMINSLNDYNNYTTFRELSFVRVLEMCFQCLPSGWFLDYMLETCFSVICLSSVKCYHKT